MNISQPSIITIVVMNGNQYSDSQYHSGILWYWPISWYYIILYIIIMNNEHGWQNNMMAAKYDEISETGRIWNSWNNSGTL